MRYRIKKRLSRYQVVTADGTPVGEHGSADAARLHLTALRTGRKAPTTAAGRRALDDRSFVLASERKFPITSPQDVRDAVSSWGRYRGPTPFETFKQYLIDLATRKGFAAALPTSWGVRTKGLPDATPGGNGGHGDGGLFANPALSGGTRRQQRIAARRRLKAARRAQTVKAPNYGARAGEAIAGNLVRGGDGKFASGGGGSAPAKDAPAKKPGKAPKPPKPTREERRAASIAATFDKQSALEEDEYYDLMDAAQGARDVDTADALVAKGLMERGEDGALRLTGSGRVAANAAARGDAGAFADAASRAAERKGAADARDTARTQREQQRAERRAAADAKRAEREAKRSAALAKREEEKPAKGGGGGGGGGGKKGDDKPDSLDRSIAELRRVAGAFGRGKAQSPAAPAFIVFKDARGGARWLAQTTTAFEDRDGEVLSVKALAADVARADADGRYGPLRWWHVGTPDPLNPVAPWGAGMDLGTCDFNAMSGRTLIESGTFKSAAIARWAAANADKLGLSPGFFHPSTEPDAAGVFHHIRRFERSLAPKDRVSNPFTALHITTTATRKESPSVDIAKITTLLDLGLDAATIKGLLNGVDATEKTADAGGVRYKTAAPEEVTFNGVAYVLKAPLPPVVAEDEDEDPAAVPPVEAKADGDDTLLEEAVEDAGADVTDLLDMDIATFRSELRAAVGEALAPILAQLKMSEKMEGMLKGMGEEMKAFYGGTKTKESAVAAEVAALKARIAELEGDRTAVQNGYRASAADATATTKAAQLAVEAQPAPLSPVEDVLAWTRQTIPQVIAGSGAVG